MKLSDYINKQDNLIDSLISATSNKLEGDFLSLRRDLQKRISKLNELSPREFTIEVDKIRNEINENYSNEIRASIFKAFNDRNRIARTHRDIVEHLGYDIGDVEYRMVDAVERFAFEKLGGQSNLVIGRVLRDLQAIEFDRRPFKEIVQSVRNNLNTGKHYAKTLANTAILSVDRAIAMDLGREAGIEWYRYQGPNDKITRKFCKEILRGENPNRATPKPVNGKWWHISWIKMLDNQQIENVRTTGGGYNCRHRWVAASFTMNEKLKKQYPELTQEA